MTITEPSQWTEVENETPEEVKDIDGAKRAMRTIHRAWAAFEEETAFERAEIERLTAFVNRRREIAQNVEDFQTRALEGWHRGKLDMDPSYRKTVPSSWGSSTLTARPVEVVVEDLDALAKAYPWAVEVITKIDATAIRSECAAQIKKSLGEPREVPAVDDNGAPINGVKLVRPEPRFKYKAPKVAAADTDSEEC